AAGAGGAGIALRARVAVVAGCPLGLGRIRADTGRGVTLARQVTLIERRADDRVPPRAAAGLAHVCARATAAVLAGGAVRLLRVGAGAARRVTLAEVVALIEGRADHRVPPGALPGLTRVRSGAEAQVVAGGAVLFRRVG